jgi:hypothetical protein
VTVYGPPPDLLYRYFPLYSDAFWRFALLDRATPSRCTSFYRDPEHNRQVGGAPRSQHLLGLAGDWVVPHEFRQHFLDVCTFLELTAVDEGSHIHVQRFEAGRLPANLFPAE